MIVTCVIILRIRSGITPSEYTDEVKSQARSKRCKEQLDGPRPHEVLVLCCGKSAGPLVEASCPSSVMVKSQHFAVFEDVRDK